MDLNLISQHPKTFLLISASSVLLGILIQMFASYYAGLLAVLIVIGIAYLIADELGLIHKIQKETTKVGNLIP